ncbi:PO113 protein, partial [Eudromia elegans]|nr:PO113 protein [Eudromia elegans]
TVQPQVVDLCMIVKTLNNIQKLAGIINWLHPHLGLRNTILEPLFQLLKGDTTLLSP